MPTIHLETLDRTAKTPLYLQIAEQIRLQISEGRLPVGTQLPTVRELARMLSVTRLTAQSAYRELQAGEWIESTVGRGTFVTASTDTDAVRAILQHDATPDLVMRDIERLTRLAGLRSMAYAEPDSALAPMAEFMRFFQHPAVQDRTLLTYGSAQGDEMLRVELVELLAMRGVEAAPEDVIVVSGVMQGLSLTTGLLTRPGDTVLVEEPTYLGMLHVLNTFGVHAQGIPMDADGVRLDALEAAIRQHRPRFFYTIPNFQNPTGICLSMERREAVLRLAEQYDFLIIEDDIYGPLAYDAKPLPAMRSMDRSGNRVIYMNSLSKVLMPGLRIGYVVAPQALQDALVFRRQASDLSGTMLIQRATAHFLHRGRFKPHLERMLVRYRERRDETMRVLSSRMPSYVTWTRPAGGFCTWVTAPTHCVPRDLHHLALTHGIAFTPGEAFLTEPDGALHLRLCFGGLSPELIREAITILGGLMGSTTPRAINRMRSGIEERPVV